jgi:hypothetical protein
MSDAEYVAQAMPVAGVNCPGSSIPEGSFPVSLKLGWHGGTHLHAPSINNVVLPVRAVADGEIVYARKPTVSTTDAAHPLNYNPYGNSPAWTDDGLVIMRHRTDIGTAANAEGVEFYSLFAHLSALTGSALKVANGTATSGERRAYRKDELGTPGRIYNAADHIQIEILCDDANLLKLTGRATGTLAVNINGRSDAIYGEVYFQIPAGTRLFTSKPADNITMPTTSVAEITTTDLFIGIRYASGDGAAAQRGSAWISTYQIDGTMLGTPVEEKDADYDMFDRATDISQLFPPAARPAASSIYEMLRFGRVLNIPTETVVPASCPHWRQIRGNAQVGWINLNAGNIRKFSDADFPDWKGWKLIDDDVNNDGRAQSASLSSIIEDASGADSQLSREELLQRLNVPLVRSALARCICKFPGEWNRDTIDARWGWLKTDPEFSLTNEDWATLRDHISALTIPAGLLPTPLTVAHWHFHPEIFIAHFRSCHWLSLQEFKQLIPKHAMRRHAGVNLWESVVTNTTAPGSITVSRRISLNRTARKYGINSPFRLASFYGNSIQETQWMGLLSEGSGSTLWYAPWYGRGFLQLTNPGNFINYWQFRGRTVPATLKTSLVEAYSTIASVNPASARSNSGLEDTHFPTLTAEMRGWRDEVRGVATANSTDSDYAPADSAGFYWAKLRMAIYADADHTLERVTLTTNQGTKYYYRSPSFWRASAAVNLPAAVNNLYSTSLNGFDARCVAYAYSLAVLSEMNFPGGPGNHAVSFPEGYLPRRN